MTELFRDLKFSCHDLVSIAYTSLCRDKEKSYRDIKFLVASTLCRDKEELCHDMGFSFLLVLCRDLKAYVVVTPRPDEVHSTCNCRDTYVHQVPL